MSPSATDSPPTITPWLVRGFRRYVRRYVRKHFDAVRLLPQQVEGSPWPDLPENTSVLIVMNHASWWDPLACVRLSEGCPAFETRSHYAPIDEDMLASYGVFKKLGFLGVAADEARGVRQFLRGGRAVLSGDAAVGRALWVTAQGRFADVRERPIELRPGVAHLLTHLESKSDTPCAVVTLAIEYTFWDQRTPEMLAAFGPVRSVADGPPDSDKHPRRVDAWQAGLTADLTATMDRLGEAAIQRDPDTFVAMSAGKSGVGGVYDVGRRLKAKLTDRDFDARHG
ncbi:MAG: lysophospholipid acyltransferase family protein [Planctomycetota bacterium]